MSAVRSRHRPPSASTPYDDQLNLFRAVAPETHQKPARPAPLPYSGPERRKLPRAAGFPISNEAFASLRSVMPEGSNVLAFIGTAVAREVEIHRALTFRQAADLFRRAGKDSRYLGKMVAFWGDRHISLIDEDAVLAAAFELYPTQSNATRNRVVLATTQSVINHALKATKKKERLSVPRLRELKVEKTPVDRAWVDAFVLEAPPKLRAICLLGYSTGARISEILSVRVQDIDLDKMQVLIRQTKVGRANWRELTPACAAALRPLCEGKAPTARAIGYASRHSAKRPWDTHCRRAGLPNRGFHTLRHAFATDLLHAGVDPVTVAKLGGWANPGKIYDTYGHARRAKGITAVLTEGGADV